MVKQQFERIQVAVPFAVMCSGTSLGTGTITSAWIARLRNMPGYRVIWARLVKSPAEESCRFKLGCHAGQLKGDCLVIGDRGAEQGASLCIGAALLEHRLSDAIN